MKKKLAVFIAAVLLLSSVTVAYARKVVNIKYVGEEFYTYNATQDQMEEAAAPYPLASGRTYYIPLVTLVDVEGEEKNGIATKASDMGDYKLRYKVTAGDSALIQNIRYAIKNDCDGRQGAFIEVTLGQNKSSSEETVDFTLTIRPQNDAAVESMMFDCDYTYSLILAPAKAGATLAPAVEAEVVQPALPQEPIHSTIQTAPVTNGNPNASNNPETGAL